MLSRVDMVYGTIAALLLGYAHFVDALAHPDLSTLAIFFFPVAAAMFGISMWRADDMWRTPLRRAAIAVSILSMAQRVAWQGGQSSAQMATLAAYGLMVGFVGVIRGSKRYIAVASFAFALDGWRPVHQLSTPRTSGSILAFRFDLLSLLWLPAAFLAGRAEPTRRICPAKPLRHCRDHGRSSPSRRQDTPARLTPQRR